MKMEPMKNPMKSLIMARKVIKMNGMIGEIPNKIKVEIASPQILTKIQKMESQGIPIRKMKKKLVKKMKWKKKNLRTRETWRLLLVMPANLETE
jgi:hypothetical protein